MHAAPWERWGLAYTTWNTSLRDLLDCQKEAGKQLRGQPVLAKTKSLETHLLRCLDISFEVRGRTEKSGQAEGLERMGHEDTRFASGEV